MLLSARFLVTGGAGFIGAAVTRSLLARGDDVTVLDTGHVAGFGYLDGLDVRLVDGDVADPAMVTEALTGCSYVVHLAARTSVPASVTAPLQDLHSNVMATVHLLEASRAADVRRFVFGSSNAVVGGHQPPMREDLPARPVSPYGAGKAAGEAYLTAYHRAYGLETVAIRFANAYGPWSAHKTSVVASFVKSYLGGGPLAIAGDGRQTRDFVHVDDIAAMVLRCLDAPADDVSGEVFQAGSGRETSLLELVERLFEVGGRRAQVVHGSRSAGDVARNYSDISKARRVVRFEPQVELGDGLSQTLDWFRGTTAKS